LKTKLKLSLGYMLQTAARFTKCKFIIDGEDEEERKITSFCHC